MKLKLITLATLSLFTTFSWGQTLLYNDGATVKIQTGATLYVEGGVHNTATGTIDNDGLLEIKGNLLNQGTWEATEPNTVKFSGNTNSDVTSGTAQFHTVIVQKDATFNVNLMDNMTINNNLDFNAPGSANVNLGAFDLTMGGAATSTGYDSDEFVVTGGAGKMKKSFTSTGSYEFPVGYTSATYNPATLNITAGPNDTYSVRVLASPTDGDGLTGTPITTDVVDAVWDIQETTVGGNTFDVTLGWSESDELTGFDDLLNAVSRNDGTTGWDALFSDLGPEVGNTRTKTGYTGFGAFAVGDKTISNTLYVNAKVLLAGPFSAGLMWDSLRVNNYIPLTEPYSTLPTNPYGHQAYGGGETVTSNAVFNQAADADDIVDWIVVELRNSATPTQILASKTGLLQRDGNIVDLDGASPLSIQGLADGNYYLGLRHRNHLGVRSDLTYALNNTTPSLVDFTLAGTAYDDATVVFPTDPMRTLTGGSKGLWPGDANFNGIVLYNGGGNDRLVILTAVGLATPGNSVSGYNRADCNLNGITLYNGGGNDRLVVLNTVGLATPGNSAAAHNNN